MGVVVRTGGRKVEDLSAESLLGGTNLPDALRQLFFVVSATISFSTFIIERKPFAHIFFQYACGPDAELHATPGFYAVTNRDDDVRNAAFDLPSNLSFAFLLNCCKICNSCRPSKLTFSKMFRMWREIVD